VGFGERLATRVVNDSKVNNFLTTDREAMDGVSLARSKAESQ